MHSRWFAGNRFMLTFNGAHTERNHNPPFAASALDFNTIRHQAREQATAMAAKRVTVLNHRPRRLLLASL